MKKDSQIVINMTEEIKVQHCAGLLKDEYPANDRSNRHPYILLQQNSIWVKLNFTA